MDGLEGPSTLLSLLLEYEGSKMCLKVPRLDDLPCAIMSAVKSRSGLNVTLKVVPVSTSTVDKEPVKELESTHVIQRWSKEFQCYVDVLSVVEVESGDKLKLVHSTQGQVSNVII